MTLALYASSPAGNVTLPYFDYPVRAIWFSCSLTFKWLGIAMWRLWSHIHGVTIVTNPVISHQWRKEREVRTTSGTYPFHLCHIYTLTVIQVMTKLLENSNSNWGRGKGFISIGTKMHYTIQKLWYIFIYNFSHNFTFQVAPHKIVSTPKNTWYI